nr:CoA transferase [uncultured Roseobacter sp.]
MTETEQFADLMRERGNVPALLSGAETDERLLKSADTLIENRRRETLARLDLTEDTTRNINPRLVHCSMTGYGRDGGSASV